jgi:DNA topoisomerase-1
VDRHTRQGASPGYGGDEKGRKQYRYHPEFIAIRDSAKFPHLVEFAEALPALRKRLRNDLRRRGLPRQKVMAVIVTLLEETLIRVGNEDYVRANASFGLTTLRNRHVHVRGEALTFQFKGKSGKIWGPSIHDRRVAKVVASCQELPGQHLFKYRDWNLIIMGEKAERDMVAEMAGKSANSTKKVTPAASVGMRSSANS